jgi:hypothetical protein
MHYQQCLELLHAHALKRCLRVLHLNVILDSTHTNVCHEPVDGRTRSGVMLFLVKKLHRLPESPLPLPSPSPCRSPRERRGEG